MSRHSLLLALALACPLFAELKTGPAISQGVVPNWPQLPKGWNFGEVSGVDVDRFDNVWVFHRGPRPVMEFDKHGKLLQAWNEVPVKSSHGIRVDPEGNVWLVDVAGHQIMKMSQDGRVKLVISNAGQAAAANNDAKYGFNRPTSLAFHPNGDFYVSDGYVNSRVVRYTKNAEYVLHWGKKGTGDSEFDIAHDVTIDRQGRLYVADRTNSRVQIFDAEGKFLGKWTDLGQPWGVYYAKGENVIYIADGLNNRVVKVNLDGQLLGVLGGFGKVAGKFDFAHHLAVDSSGSIYVAEIKNWRVQKFAIVR